MLACGTARRTSSVLALDFLSPHIFRRNKTAFGRPPAPAKPKANYQNRVAKRVQDTSSTSEGSQNIVPLIDLLGDKLRDFHKKPVEGLTGSQSKAFDGAVAELISAGQRADLNAAWEVWNALKDMDLVRFFGPSHHNIYARITSDICRTKPQHQPWTPEQREILDEINVVGAAGGETEGLRSYMISFIGRNDPASVLHLYGRYRALLDEKFSWRDVGDHGEANDEGIGHLPPGKQNDLVRGDILLCAITAHAMQDSFFDAFQTALQTSVRFPESNIPESTRFLKYDDQLRRKVSDYVHRLEVARLLARPAALSRQLSNLTRDSADRLLERLYKDIVTGASGPDAYLTVKAAQTSTEKRVLVPNLIWPSLISGFMRCRRTDLAEKLWDDMNRLGVPTTVTMWTALIDGYAGLKAVNEAVHTWNIMQAQRIKPDAMTYRALIYALSHGGDPDNAYKRFKDFQQDLPKLSPPPEQTEVLTVYNTMLHGLLFHSREADATALLKEMQAAGPTPDIVTFNSFLRYYGRKGQYKMLAGTLHMIESSGLVGDVWTFSTVLSALLQVRDDAPQIVLDLMARQGIKPNAATLTTIIDNQLKLQTEKGLRTALELLEKMEQNEDKEAQPSEITYTSILAGIHRGNWLQRNVSEEYRKHIWEKMRARNITPMRTTFNYLIKACFDNPGREGIEDALQYYRDMAARKIFIANDTWYIILHGLVERDEWALANELVQNMHDSGFQPAGALSELVSRIRRRNLRRVLAGPASYI